MSATDSRIRLEGAFEQAEAFAWALETAAHQLERFSFTAQALTAVLRAHAASGPALAACRRRWQEPGVAEVLQRIDRAEAAVIAQARRVCHELGLAPPPPTVRGALAALEPALPLVLRQWIVAPVRVWVQVCALTIMTLGAALIPGGPPLGLPFSLMLALRLAAIGWQARRVLVSGAWLVIGSRGVSLSSTRAVRVELPSLASRSRERAVITVEHDTGWSVEPLPDALEDVVPALRSVGIEPQVRRVW